MVLKFSEKEPPLTKDPKKILENFPFNLPKKYLEILKENDGGCVDYDFRYYDNSFEEELPGSIAIFFGLQCEDGDNLIVRYKKLPDFFPENLIPFGEDGGGNFVCFDYRDNPKSEDPPITYWIHDYEDEKSLSFIAKDFEEFLSILKEPEEGED